MTSQDRGNLLHAAHRRAKLLGLTGEDYERALAMVDEETTPNTADFARENAG